MIETQSNEVQELANIFKNCELLGVHNIKSTFIVNRGAKNIVKANKIEKALHVDTLADRLMADPKLVSLLKRCGKKVTYKSKLYKAHKKNVQGIDFTISWGNQHEITL